MHKLLGIKEKKVSHLRYNDKKSTTILVVFPLNLVSYYSAGCDLSIIVISNYFYRIDIVCFVGLPYHSLSKSD